MSAKISKSGLLMILYAIAGVLLFVVVPMFIDSDQVGQISVETYAVCTPCAILMGEIIEDSRDYIKMACLLVVFFIGSFGVLNLL